MKYKIVSILNFVPLFDESNMKLIIVYSISIKNFQYWSVKATSLHSLVSYALVNVMFFVKLMSCKLSKMGRRYVISFPQIIYIHIIVNHLN